MDTVTDATTPTLPPDPERYDSPRDARARAKGLPGPYIAGGDDPDIGPALAEDRRLWRWLIAMVVTIVGAGFVIGTILALVGPTSGS
jgi:hypothetical protein